MCGRQIQSRAQQRRMHAVPSGIIFVCWGCEQMRGLCLELDFRNWKRVLRGMHVQRRVLWSERRDMRGM